MSEPARSIKEMDWLDPKVAARQLVRSQSGKVWLDAFSEHLDRYRNADALQRILAVWGLNQSDAAHLFQVTRQAVSKWLDKGVAPDRAAHVPGYVRVRLSTRLAGLACSILRGATPSRAQDVCDGHTPGAFRPQEVGYLTQREFCMESVFFYGLFMDEDLLRAKGCLPDACEIAYVEGYELRIGERATLVKSPNGRAYGLVAELSAAHLDLLYSDPGVADYKPESVLAFELSGRQRKAISYLLPVEKLSGENETYAASLVKVATKLGLPQPYLDEIGRWAAKE